MLNKIPLRKNNIIQIVGKDGLLLYELNFPQATLKETIEFQEMSPPQIAKWFSDFIVKYWTYKYCVEVKRKRYELPFFFKRRKFRIEQENKIKIDWYIADNSTVFVASIIDNLHKKWNTLYDWITKALSKWEERRKCILWSMFMTICKEWNLNGLNDLLENYTLEQFQFMSDCVIFQSYELSKEWRNANNRLFTWSDLSNDQSKLIDFYKDFEEKWLSKQNQ